MSLKRIFEPEVADYLLQNGAELKRIERHRTNTTATVFQFVQNTKLDDLLASYRR
ncbi:DUF5659 domain-containing protein [Halobacillus kuroshimensis]|uniref:DUF5659 domain-containing protein n=1 Tax=Halobacillus kuroshimensis TaxID=302481 RepID=UPI003CC7F06A